LEAVPQRNAKEQLVAGASKVLLEKGYNAASVGDIVAAAGVPKGSVYNHFDSKEELALEALRRYIASYPIDALATGEGKPLRRLRASFEATSERTVERGVTCGCMLGNFSTELVGEPIAAMVAAALTHWSEAVSAVLRQAQEAGELDRDLDPEELGPYLVDAYEGAVSRAKLAGDRAPMDAFIATTFDTLLAR
jgi:TetR/AcrR family transcriptional regulator, transcriptional repressor for nem operon